MDYALAKQLKDAGYNFQRANTEVFMYATGIGNDMAILGNNEYLITFDGGWFIVPTLSELIEACGEGFATLLRCGCEECKWNCYGKSVQPICDFPNCWCEGVGRHSFNGQTPEEAVARLWLALNKK